jgi:hypothetical protein
MTSDRLPRKMPAMRILLAVTVLLATAPAFADGTVLRAKGCGDKMFVAGENDYAALSGAPPNIAKDGDRLVGNIDRLGFGSFFLPQSSEHFSAMVDERGLSKSEITTRIAASCHAATGNRLTSGQVERAAGCGNKIFVNTVEGYAVLERLAGGLVYAGDTLTGDFGRAGRTTVKDHQTNEELTVFVDDFQLSKSAARRKINASCR